MSDVLEEAVQLILVLDVSELLPLRLIFAATKPQLSPLPFCHVVFGEQLIAVLIEPKQEPATLFSRHLTNCGFDLVKTHSPKLQRHG